MSVSKFREKQNEDATSGDLFHNIDIEKVPVMSDAPFSEAQTSVPASLASNLLANSLMTKFPNFVLPKNQQVVWIPPLQNKHPDISQNISVPRSKPPPTIPFGTHQYLEHQEQVIRASNRNVRVLQRQFNEQQNAICFGKMENKRLSQRVLQHEERIEYLETQRELEKDNAKKYLNERNEALQKVANLEKNNLEVVNSKKTLEIQLALANQTILQLRNEINAQSDVYREGVGFLRRELEKQHEMILENLRKEMKEKEKNWKKEREELMKRNLEN
ncbi:hypothetical protein B9Z55_007322 [Caenorhabditis nigoni]|uniref:Uncharacterized protein n=1 Tax=Caenorhabditis nigoni TaxID=1611254 RepID=A0A2G5V935_9PELO|nr:hypothetical protein B9Z55_007322 [Caenorhabditis nigoni]